MYPFSYSQETFFASEFGYSSSCLKTLTHTSPITVEETVAFPPAPKIFYSEAKSGVQNGRVAAMQRVVNLTVQQGPSWEEGDILQETMEIF